jgi:hypothetical protein
MSDLLQRDVDRGARALYKRQTRGEWLTRGAAALPDLATAT